MRRTPPLSRSAAGALVVLAVLTAGPAVIPTPAAAAPVSSAGFTVAGGPTGDLSLPPGQVVPADFTVINSSGTAEQIDVTITGLHFNGQTPEFTGSPSPGLHVAVDHTTLTLGPQASQGVDLSVEATPGSRPGGLYAGVVFKEIPPASRGSATIEEAQARPLIGHVPGPTTDTGEIQAFAAPAATARPGQVVFDLTFLDTGDIDYRLGGTLGLVTTAGSQIATVAVPAATVLPGNPRTVPLNYPGAAPAGQLTGRLRLTWGSTAEHAGTAMATLLITGPGGASPGRGSGGGVGGGRHQTVTLIPSPSTHHPVSWIFKGLALLLLLIIIALLIRRYLQRRRHQRHLQQLRGLQVLREEE